MIKCTMSKIMRERLSAWLADHEDPSLIEETLAADRAIRHLALSGPAEAASAVDKFLLEEAFEIMFNIYENCVDERDLLAAGGGRCECGSQRCAIEHRSKESWWPEDYREFIGDKDAKNKL